LHHFPHAFNRAGLGMRTSYRIMTTPIVDNWTAKYAEGCEWCGTRIPAMKSKTGRKTGGLERAHILAKGNAPEHEWNVFILCPTCHKIFDEVIKPRMQAALETAVCGFAENPSSKDISHICAKDYREAVEMLTRDPDRPLRGRTKGKHFDVWKYRSKGPASAGKGPAVIQASAEQRPAISPIVVAPPR
jgi:hypothetical protein